MSKQTPKGALSARDIGSDLGVSLTRAYEIVRECDHIRIGERGLRVPREAYERVEGCSHSAGGPRHPGRKSGARPREHGTGKAMATDAKGEARDIERRIVDSTTLGTAAGRAAKRVTDQADRPAHQTAHLALLRQALRILERVAGSQAYVLAANRVQHRGYAGVSVPHQLLVVRAAETPCTAAAEDAPRANLPGSLKNTSGVERKHHAPNTPVTAMLA